MKTLTLMRHAKSGWDDGGLRDVDRPLNAKGRRAAETMGRHLADRGMRFDRVIASPAVRVAETLDALRSGYGTLPEAEWDRRVYLASAETLMEVVRGLPDAAEHVLLMGHNPAMEELALLLVPPGAEGRDAVARKYPTAAVAAMTLPADRWADAAEGTARLDRFVRPRDLDPELGPDAD